MWLVESLSDDDTHTLLLVLRQLVPRLSDVSDGRSSDVDLSDSDEDDAMDVDGQVQYAVYTLISPRCCLRWT